MTRTALVLVDLMPRIIALPTAPHTGAHVLARGQRLAGAFRERGALVVSVIVERPGVAEQPAGSELAVTPADGDVMVVKKAIGAFPSSGIDDVLRTRDIETVVPGGIATNFGVEYVFPGFGEVVTTDELLAQLPTLE